MNHGLSGKVSYLIVINCHLGDVTQDARHIDVRGGNPSCHRLTIVRKLEAVQ